MQNKPPSQATAVAKGRAFTIHIAGADHPNKRGPARRFGIALCQPGDRLELRLEPTNPVDPQAVAIYERGGIQLGYVPGERCQWVTSMMKRGGELVALFQAAASHGAFVRIGIDHVPALPASGQHRPADADEDYPPDPRWDENE